MISDITKNCIKAKELIQSQPDNSKIRVVSHYDADGITSAAIICKMLYRMGYSFHCSLMRNPFDRGLKIVSNEENNLIIFTDMGSGQIEMIEKIDAKSIIIDHHQIKKEKTDEKIIQINANQYGINGNYEACGATLSYFFAKTIDPKNKDLVGLAIAGATGDKQYIGGFRGFNKEIIDDGIKNNFLKQKTCIKLTGETIYESLFYSIDPYYSELSGNNKKIMELIDKIGISKETTIKELDEKQIRQLNSYLMLILIRNGCEKNILDTVIRNRYKSEIIFNCESEMFADLLDSCGKGGNRGLGFATAMGDEESFIEAIELEKEYKTKILKELISLEKDGFLEKKNFRYFYSKNSSLGGVIGGIATNFMLDIKKPLISIVRNKDEIHVSCRGNQTLVKRGLDLGDAMKKAAQKLDGHGGGHAIAAGATIKLEKEEEFLEFTDKIIDGQIKK